jgi:hypothetical protein
MLKDDGDDAMKDLDPRFLATRVYNSFMKHSADVAFASQDKDAPGANEKLQQQIDDMSATMEELFGDAGEDMFSEELDFAFSYPCSLPVFWAKKKNRTYMTLSDEVLNELTRMFQEGQGSTNKAVRYNAERAVMELSNGILKFLWDQKLICSISKVKSYFSRKHQSEESENDANRRATSEDSMAARQERGEQVLVDNRRCEEALFRAMDKPADSSASLETAAMSTFHSIAVNLLRAFIKCRILDDATCTSLDKKMPKKGTLSQAENGIICSKTSNPLLSRWAHDLRNEPVKAKVGNPTEQEAGQELEMHLWSQIVNDQQEEQEEFEIFEDVANDLTLAQKNGIEEIDNNQEPPEADEDSGDDSDFEVDGD